MCCATKLSVICIFEERKLDLSVSPLVNGGLMVDPKSTRYYDPYDVHYSMLRQGSYISFHVCITSFQLASLVVTSPCSVTFPYAFIEDYFLAVGRHIYVRF